MKKAFTLIILFLFTVVNSAQNPSEVLSKDHSIDSNKVILPDATYKLVSQVITNFLSSYHYKKQPLNDSLSAFIFKEYLNTLDNSKLYFLKSDVDKFEQYINEFDDFLRTGNLDPAFEIFNVFKMRLSERIKYIDFLLKQDMDFNTDESFTPDRTKADWAVSVEDLNELWRLRIKNDELNQLLSGKELKDIPGILTKRYHNYHKIILQYEAEDVFSLFMNSFTQVYDPHTDYFSPSNSENFAIAMKLSLEGIGATLRQDGDYTTVATIVPGGPAYKSKLIHEEDRIIGVAQGEEGEMVDVIGWRLDDAIQLIRGKKGTIVRLQLLRAKDGPNPPPVEIKILREEVKLEEQAAKDEIINVQEKGTNFKFGVVKLPSFYTDFEGQQKRKPDYRSTTRDVKKILNKFKEEKVDGVILDLRNNGGGSLQEAIQLTGLFIKEGPVVQVRNSANNVEIDKDQDPEIVYDGPLTVMINRFSASASEIFAAAIQDYGRGLIVGSNSYGKGTVQNMIDLNRAITIGNKKLGQLKLTIAKFYRITGSTTQLLGVKPDISFPSQFISKEFGEGGQESALPWDQIPATQFNRYSDLPKSISLLETNHNERIKNDPEFQYLLEDIQEYNRNRNRKEISLNEAVRKRERDDAEAKRKQREEERAKSLGIKLEEKKEVDPPASKISDYELKESGRILADLILSKVG
ncbi:MAG: tail-specific protease [Ignavibacteriae bacterium HGW-Ignavibacteriae-3]|nr:MAG: tail-specific protease [Ignavibacteriae bacterium HGW-Ignavibacteriae-3]